MSRKNNTQHENKLIISRSQKISLACLNMTVVISRQGPCGWTWVIHWVWRLNPFRTGTISCAKQWALHLRGQLGEPKLGKTFYKWRKPHCKDNLFLMEKPHSSSLIPFMSISLWENYDNHLKIISKGGKEERKYVSGKYIAKRM